MRGSRPAIAVALVLGLLALAQPARASRPDCGDLLSALTLGKSREQVAGEFSTTQARIGACEALARQHERQADQRQQFEARRAEHGLPPNQ